MSLVISSIFTYDTDAGNYIQAVETADGQALESATRKAINDFVIGCKQDEIWDAIKASCILSGARTLAGALVPLVGTAPTNFNFVSGDYNRKTGLVGNGSTKYLDSSRAINADDALNQHVSVYISTSSNNTWLGAATGGSGYTSLESSGLYCGSTTAVPSSSTLTGFAGVARNNNTLHTGRRAGQSLTTDNSAAAKNETRNYPVFAYRTAATLSSYASARLAFYSIGKSLDLARLDGRVTDLINKFSKVIP